eukprot:86763-Pelagomonas_calceolata.AAC.1
MHRLDLQLCNTLTCPAYLLQRASKGVYDKNGRKENDEGTGTPPTCTNKGGEKYCETWVVRAVSFSLEEQNKGADLEKEGRTYVTQHQIGLGRCIFLGTLLVVATLWATWIGWRLASL